MNIVTETTDLISAALEGDPALESLTVSGGLPNTLAAKIAPGVPARTIAGSTYSPQPPFLRETLTELVVRAQRLRWRRFDPVRRMLIPPTDDELLAMHTCHVRATAGFECGAGWTDLLDTVFTWLNEIAPHHAWSPSQIKEKLGTLRFYWWGDLPNLADQVIDAAEHVSAHVCEVCGAPGALRDDHGWLSTRCRHHWDRPT